MLATSNKQTRKLLHPLKSRIEVAYNKHIKNTHADATILFMLQDQQLQLQSQLYDIFKKSALRLQYMQI